MSDNVATTQQQLPGNPENFYTHRKFIEGSKLLPYLASKFPDKELLRRASGIFTLSEALQYLKDVISREILYDTGNPAVILCGEELEEALNMRALHLSEIREQVCKQLQEVMPLVEDNRSGNDGENQRRIEGAAPQSLGGQGGGPTPVSGGGPTPVSGGGPTPAPPTVPNTHSSSPNTQSFTSNTHSSTSNISSSPSVPLPRNNLPLTLPQNTNSNSNSAAPVAVVQPFRPPRAAQPVQPPRAAQPVQPAQTPRPGANRLVTANISPEAEFRVKDAFLRVLHKLNNVDKEKRIFTYIELTRYLSQYILLHKHSFFDDRNIKVALVEDDDLGIAFGVKAFHRTQVTGFLRSQLIELSREEKEAREDQRRRQGGQPQALPDSSSAPNTPTTQRRSTNNQQQQQPQQPTTITVGGGRAVQQQSSLNQGNLLFGPPRPLEVTAMAATVQAQPLVIQGQRQLFLQSSVASATLTQNNRRKRPNSPERGEEMDISPADAISIALAEKESASKRSRRQRRRRVSIGVLVEDGNEDGYTSGETIYSMQGYETVAVIANDSDSSDDDEATRYSFSADDHTEYEIDSEADRENENKDGESGSEEDSDIQEDFTIDVIIEQPNRDTNDGDSESDSDVVYDPEIGLKDSWTCKECGEMNQPIKGKCNRCWKARRGWVPERKHPKNKQKRTRGLQVKTTTTTLRARHHSDSDLEEGMSSQKTSTDSGCSQEMVESQSLEMVDSPISSDSEKVKTEDLPRRNNTVATSKPELMCNFCLSREKNAGIVHGRITHQICCYPCAKRLMKHRKPCPICRRKIEKITKIVVG